MVSVSTCAMYLASAVVSLSKQMKITGFRAQWCCGCTKKKKKKKRFRWKQRESYSTSGSRRWAHLWWSCKRNTETAKLTRSFWNTRTCCCDWQRPTPEYTVRVWERGGRNPGRPQALTAKRKRLHVCGHVRSRAAGGCCTVIRNKFSLFSS